MLTGSVKSGIKESQSTASVSLVDVEIFINVYIPIAEAVLDIYHGHYRLGFIMYIRYNYSHFG